MTVAVALGFLVGLVLALTGAGGGILAVPLLIFGLGMPLAQAAPVALLAVGIAAAIGAAIGLRAGNVRYRAAALMAASGFVGAPLGWWLSRRIPNTGLTLAFAGVMVFSCTRMFLRARAEVLGKPLPARGAPAPCTLDRSIGRLRWTLPCARALAAAGFTTGVLSSLLGVGGGFVIVPALMRVTDLDMHAITATSLAVIALVSAGSIALAGIGGQGLAGTTALLFVCGAALGLVLGRACAHWLSGPRLQQAFAVVGLLVAALLVVRSAVA